MIRHRVLRHMLLIAFAGVASVGCRGDTATSSVSDSVFVAVMAELKRVHEAAGLDSAQREERRTAILKRRGLTPERLDTAARALARNPTRAQTVWQAIERRAADSAASK